MTPSKPKRPTEAELDVLRVLWTRGPSTVREVHEAIRSHRVAYTTTLKTMQVMHEKGLLRRDESKRSHVYHARVGEERTQRQLVRSLLDQAFSGSRPTLLLRALSDRPVAPEELAELRRILREVEKENE
ncbi:MAG: BlaI/MecI/CopY family transcriptional regulator [Planctomycetota bacterium]